MKAGVHRAGTAWMPESSTLPSPPRCRRLVSSYPGPGASAAAGTGDGDGENAGLIGLVAPGVPRAVLHQDVAGHQVHFHTVVKFHVDLAGEHEVDVDRVR